MDGLFVIKRIVPAAGETPEQVLVLADGTLEGPLCVEGPEHTARHTLDVAAHLYASKPKILDRQGSAETVTFTIARQHASLAASVSHWANHFQKVRGVATLQIELTEGGTTFIWKAERAGWESVDVPAPDGVSTWTRYRVLVPELTRSPSADDDTVTVDSTELTADSQ